MDEVFLRFPHLGQQTFEMLEGQDLSNCMQVSRAWKKFITDENLHTLYMIQMYTRCSKAKLRQVLKETDLKTLAKDVNECFTRIQLYTGCSKAKLRQILKKTDLTTLEIDLNELSNNGLIFQPPGWGSSYLGFVKKDLALFHMAAANGHLAICELIIENAKDKNPKSFVGPHLHPYNGSDGYDLTPLHLAANNGHFEICTLIIEMVENKNPKSGMALEGMTALEMAKKWGHENISTLIKSAIGYMY